MTNRKESKRARPVPAETGTNNNRIGQPIPNLVVPADRIRHFAEIDLGTLDQLPDNRQDLIALSIRMEAAFDALCKSVLEFIAEDFEEIRREASVNSSRGQ